MATVTRFPDEGEQYEAARKAIEYLIEIDALSEGKSDELESMLLDVIENYFEAQETGSEEAIKPGWIVAAHALEIRGNRYWYTNQEIEAVNRIKEKHPDDWEDEVLSAMRFNRLKPRL